MAIDVEQLYSEIIKNTLMNFNGAARYAVMRNWRRMTMAQRRSAVRALGVLEDVAMNPAGYFSRATTMDAWAGRSHRVVTMDNATTPFNSAEMESGPADIVATSAGAAFEYVLELRYLFQCFCRAVVDWEYDRTSSDADRQHQAYMHMDKVTDIMSKSNTWRKRQSAIIRHTTAKER